MFHSFALKNQHLRDNLPFRPKMSAKH